MNLHAELSVARRLSERWFREIGESVVGASVVLAVKSVVWYVLFGSLFQEIASLPSSPRRTTGRLSCRASSACWRWSTSASVATGSSMTSTSGCSGSSGPRPSAGRRWLSRVVVMGSLNAFQVAVLLAVVALDGVHLETEWAGFLALVAFSVWLTAGLTSLSMVIAYALKYEFAFSAVTSFLVLPVVFVSNAFVPTRLLPGWLRVVADANPLSLSIAGMRTLVLDGWVAAELLPAATTVVGTALASSVVAAVAFEWPLEPESSLVWWTGDT